jgi:RNA polymerase sigma factor (sigma-70 family)
MSEATRVARSRGGGRKVGRYSGALETYLRSIRRYELLTKSGEFRIGTQVRAGQEKARQDLVEANLRLVVKLAMEYRHARIGLDDLIAEGNLGLIEAAGRFDPQRGVRFATYASWWIRKFLIQAIDRQAHQTTSPTRDASDKPSDGAAKPQVPQRQRIISVDDFMQTSSDRNVLERFQLKDAVDPQDAALEKQLATKLTAILPKLPPQERMILAAHYGLEGQPPRTLQQIGKEMSLTRERVRQIEQRAIARARRLLS